jgi:hypothetical protein
LSYGALKEILDYTNIKDPEIVKIEGVVEE